MTDEQSEPQPEQDEPGFQPVPTPPSDPSTATDTNDPPEDVEQPNRGVEDVGRIGVKYGKPLGSIKP